MWLAPTFSLQQETRNLAERELWTLPRGGSVEVRCQDGSLWVTAGPDDLIVDSGQARQVQAREPVVIQALRPARVTIRRVI